MAEKVYTVAEAKRILHGPDLIHTAATVIAAHTLMEACEHLASARTPNGKSLPAHLRLGATSRAQLLLLLRT
jgi:hypothetical protein